MQRAFFHSKLSVYKDDKERVQKEKGKLATRLKYYKIRLQYTEPDLVRKQGMKAALTCTVNSLQQSEQKMVWNKSLILANTESVNSSNQAPQGTPPARDEKFAPSVPMHLAGIQPRYITLYYLASNDKWASYNISQTIMLNRELLLQKWYFCTELKDLAQSWSLPSSLYRLRPKKDILLFCHWNWPSSLRSLPTPNWIRRFAFHHHHTRMQARSYCN